MRKIVSILCVLCASAMLMAQSSSAEGVHPYKVFDNVSWEHAGWSINPYVGGNFFFGDFLSSEIANNFATMGLPTLGLGVDYAFNPAWSIGVEYDFAMYGVKGNQKKGNNAETLLKGDMHRGSLYLNTDLVNLIAPFAKKKPVALNIQAGAGGFVFKNSVYYDMSEENTAGRQARGNTKDLTPQSKKDYTFETFLKFGLGLEFNINRTLALGARVSYNLFLSDLVDGRKFNPNTDGMLDLAINMRFKLMAVSRTHARNVGGRDYPDMRGVVAGNVREITRELVDKEVAAAYAAGAEEMHRQDELAAQLHHDTVIIRETLRETVVEHDGQALAAQPATNAAAQEQPVAAPRTSINPYYYIYFESGKAGLNEEGLITLQQVADRMLDDPELYAIVTTYCDNTGSANANYVMGERRAANVINELHREYDIPTEHLYGATNGKVQSKRGGNGSFSPNRRAVIKLVDKATFDRLRGELDNTKTKREEDTKKLSAGQVNADAYAARPNIKVKTDNSTSLAKLARQYYSNTHCWVYIYLANRDKMPDANTVAQGTELRIPELTDAERATTKDQCLRIYQTNRSKK